MAKLSGDKIKKEIKIGNITINPFNEKYLGPNSYDLTLGNTILRYVPKVLDVKKLNFVVEQKIPDSGLILRPGEIYLAHTNEIAGSACYVPCIEGRSSMARLGIQVHLTAGFGDIGFIAQWTLEIAVVKPVKIYKDIKICQIYFDTIDGDVNTLYNGKYKNSRGAVQSKAYKDFE